MATSRTVLVVAAHPDDEVLGCGGTIARHSLAGDAVHVAILAEGIASRDDTLTGMVREAKLASLSEAAKRANELLGVQSVELLQLPDNRLDSLDRLDLVKTVEALMRRNRPDIVYTHHAGDVNIDHRLAHEAVATACRPLPGQSVRTLLAFEIASSTEWQPVGSAPAFLANWFVDISQTLPRKLAALDAYCSEMRPWPHARSIQALEHLARWRGASVGVAAAEAFMLGRTLL